MVGERLQCCSCSVWSCLLDTMIVQYKIDHRSKKKKNLGSGEETRVSVCARVEEHCRSGFQTLTTDKAKNIFFILFSNTQLVKL